MSTRKHILFLWLFISFLPHANRQYQLYFNRLNTQHETNILWNQDCEVHKLNPIHGIRVLELSSRGGCCHPVSRQDSAAAATAVDPDASASRIGLHQLHRRKVIEIPQIV